MKHGVRVIFLLMLVIKTGPLCAAERGDDKFAGWVKAALCVGALSAGVMTVYMLVRSWLGQREHIAAEEARWAIEQKAAEEERRRLIVAAEAERRCLIVADTAKIQLGAIERKAAEEAVQRVVTGESMSKSQARSAVVSPFLAHVRVLQELKKPKQLDLPITIPTINQVLAMHGHSQTGTFLASDDTYKTAYFSRREYWRKPFFRGVIQLILNREREHADRYYVLYHGETFGVWFLQHVIKKIESCMQLLPDKSAFVYLRSPAETLYEQNVTQFLDLYKTQPQSSFDHADSVRKILLATNVTLFGNISGIGEASLDYWMYNWNVSVPDSSSILKKFFEKYGLMNQCYVGSIMKLLERVRGLMRNRHMGGCLLQIFIPKEKIDACAYPCGAFGVPMQPFKPLSEILEHLSASDLNIQARLVITPSLNRPDSGMEVYQYPLAMLSEDFCKEFEQVERELDTILSAMCDELVEQRAAGFPFARLARYVASAIKS